MSIWAFRNIAFSMTNVYVLEFLVLRLNWHYGRRYTILWLRIKRLCLEQEVYMVPFL